MRVFVAILVLLVAAAPPSATALPPETLVDVSPDDAHSNPNGVAIGGQNADGGILGLAVFGDAWGWTVGMSLLGDARAGMLGIAPAGEAESEIAVGTMAGYGHTAGASVLGPATGQYAVSVFGSADSDDDPLAVSVFGNARGGTLAVSVFGDSEARILAVSGTGHADGRDSVGVCHEVELMCFNPWLVLQSILA